MATSRVDGVKAPPHDGTPRSRLAIWMFLPIGDASSKSSSTQFTNVPSNAKQKRMARAPRTSPLLSLAKKAFNCDGVESDAKSLARTAKNGALFDMSRAIKPET